MIEEWRKRREGKNGWRGSIHIMVNNDKQIKKRKWKDKNGWDESIHDDKQS